MSHRIRIEDKTGSLCDTCRHASERRAMGTNRKYIICRSASYDSIYITKPMEVCSDYTDSSHIDLNDMKKLAWVINLDQKKAQIGFKKPSELEKTSNYDSTPKELENLEDGLPKKLRDL